MHNARALELSLAGQVGVAVVRFINIAEAVAIINTTHTTTTTR